MGTFDTYKLHRRRRMHSLASARDRVRGTLDYMTLWDATTCWLHSPALIARTADDGPQIWTFYKLTEQNEQNQL